MAKYTLLYDDVCLNENRFVKRAQHAEIGDHIYRDRSLMRALIPEHEICPMAEGAESQTRNIAIKR